MLPARMVSGVRTLSSYVIGKPWPPQWLALTVGVFAAHNQKSLTAIVISALICGAISSYWRDWHN